MKLNKYFLIAIATFGLFSCSSDNDETAVKGKKAVTLNIQLPNSSRAIQDPSSGNPQGKLAVNVNHVTVNFVGTEDSRTLTYTSGTTEYTFFDVPETCTGVEVIINNNGALTSNATAETEKGTDVTCYGYATGLTRATTSAEQGGRTYDTYEITVNVTPALVRIEASGLQLIDEEGNPATAQTSEFATLNFAGIFLNGYNETGTITTDGSIAPSDLKKITSSTPEADLEAAKALSMSDFLPEATSIFGETFPETGKCYAYNFFASTPEITLAFTDATLNQGACAPTRFAVVKSYKDGDGNAITNFTPGNIYQITALKVMDKNITGDIEGNADIAVVATINVIPWNIVATEVEWK